ncbi:Hypothetical predicted protein [Podarcis lilfordi]|uniref:Uncharacterized protein n=1 Tax=Podarcis lilfordi TaxID=74358 RepID=A0AA35JPH4_9SAUR|nr:Hypothetical predicted protein [Podarcis lilfordi]
MDEWKMRCFRNLRDSRLQNTSSNPLALFKKSAKVAHCSAGAPWFNTSCKQARSLLRSIYNEYKNSNTQALPSSYLQAKRAYKQTLKLAKREWYLKRWRALIAASRSRRPQEFWALINKRGRKYPLTIIPAPTWEQFLSKYFSLAEESNSSTEFRADHLPLWPSTDPDLIMDLILDLKTGKAPGLDLVPAEAILAQPRWVQFNIVGDIAESVSPSPPETPHVCEQRSHTSGVKDCIIGDGHLEASLWLLAVQLAQASQPLPFQCLWRDDFVNPWVGKIHAKLLSIGISPADSLKMNLRSAKRLIEQRLADIENQHNLAGVRVSAPQVSRNNLTTWPSIIHVISFICTTPTCIYSCKVQCLSIEPAEPQIFQGFGVSAMRV